LKTAWLLLEARFRAKVCAFSSILSTARLRARLKKNARNAPAVPRRTAAVPSTSFVRNLT
jgi:hypothetical protein